MAEVSRFWITNGTGDGPAGGYTAAQFYEFLRSVFTNDSYATQGPLFGDRNQLAVSGTASPLAVASGSAICYGMYYENTASLNLTVTTPIVGTTGGRVNIYANWTAQTIRAVAVRNTDGVSAIPALRQTPGTEYEIPLATFTITTGGVITLTDARVYCEFGTKVQDNAVDADAIQTGAVTGTKIPSNTITESHIQDGAITYNKIADHNIMFSKFPPPTTDIGVIAYYTPSTDPDRIVSIANGEVCMRKSDGIQFTKLSEANVYHRIATMVHRQGGHSMNWDTTGTTDYTLPDYYLPQIQCGCITTSSGTIQVTFGKTYYGIPLIFAWCPETADSRVTISGSNGGVFTINTTNHAGTNINAKVFWMALGVTSGV